MVIFHSYVKLPEGKPSINSGFRNHPQVDLSGSFANIPCQAWAQTSLHMASLARTYPWRYPGTRLLGWRLSGRLHDLSCGFSPGPMDLQILQWMTWNDPKFWIFCLLMPLKNRQLQKLTQSTSSQTASLRVLQVLFHPALLGVLALQQLGQLDAKTEMCVAP